MFIEELSRLKDEKKLIAVYTNIDNTNKFAAGYVVGVNEQYFILAAITPAGKYDGFLLKKTEPIYKISTDGRYIDKLLQLISINKTEVNLMFDHDNLIQQLLVFAQQNRAIVSVELIDSGYDDCIGFVELIDENVCKIQEINEYGEADGVSLIKLSDITKVSCDDSDDQPLKLLYESRL